MPLKFQISFYEHQRNKNWSTVDFLQITYAATWKTSKELLFSKDAQGFEEFDFILSDVWRIKKVFKGFLGL